MENLKVYTALLCKFASCVYIFASAFSGIDNQTRTYRVAMAIYLTTISMSLEN